MTRRPRTEEKRATIKRKRQRAMSKVHGGTKSKAHENEALKQIWRDAREKVPTAERTDARVRGERSQHNHTANPDGYEDDAPDSTL